MTVKKKIFIGVAVLALAAGLYGYKEYNRRNKDLANVRADMKMNSADLINAFKKNETEANKNFLDKVIQVEGTVKEVIKDEKGYYTVVVQFVVDIDGRISDIKPLTKHGYGLEEEAVRVLRKATKWEPGIQNGYPVKSYRKQPITFRVTSE